MVSYKDTFIQIAPDCPDVSGVVPTSRGENKPLHLIQYELLAERPYGYTHEELLFEVHVRHKGIGHAELEARGEEIRAELFSRSHPCLRASMLPKKYGWGVHYDSEGCIALYARDSAEYRQFTQGGESGPTLLYAMRNRREKK